MATIGASLRLYDQITDTLSRAEQGVQSLITAAERLNAVAQRPVEIQVDTGRAATEIHALESRLASVVGTTQVQVSVGVGDINQQIGQLQQQLRSALADAVVRVTVDADAALQESAQLKGRLETELAPSLKPVLDQSGISDHLRALTDRLTRDTSMALRIMLDTGQALSQLEPLKEQLMTRWGTVSLRMEMDQSGLQRGLAALEDVRTAAAAPLVLRADTAAAEAQIDALRAQLAAVTSGATIRVTVGAEDLTQEIGRMQQQLRNALSSAAVQVTLDSGGALQEAARLRSQLEAQAGSVTVQVQLDGSRVQAELQALLAQLASRALAISIPIQIDSAQAVAQLTPLRQQLTSMIGTIQVEVIARLDRSRILADLAALRAQVSHSVAAVSLSLTIDAAQALAQIEPVKQQLAARLGTIEAELRITLPNTLQDMLVDLRRLVLQLLRSVRRIRQTLPTGAAQQLAAALQRIEELERRVQQLQDQINNSVNRTQGSTGNWLSGLKGILATYLSIAGAAKLLSATVGASMEQLKMEDMFKARTGDAEVGSAMFDKFRAEALAAGQDVNEYLKGTLSFFSATQNTDQLSKLNNLMTRLNAFDSAGNGIEGAAFALKEAMSGDIVSLAERFNMSKSDIRDFKVDEMGKAGNMEGFIEAFDKLLEKQKMGQEAFDTMMASPAKQLEILGNNVRSMFADAGGDAVDALLPLIQLLNDAFKEGKFQPFFDGLANGLATAADWVRILYEAIVPVYDFFVNNWSAIAPVIEGAGVALAAFVVISRAYAIQQAIAAISTGTSTAAIFLQTLATSGLAAAWATLNKVMKANVIIFIVSLIIGLIVWLVKLWQTNDAFALAMVKAWHTILNFMDQVPIFFMGVWNGIVDGAQAMKVATLEILEGLINGSIDKINDFIAALNNIPGIHLDAVQHVSFAAEAAAEAEALRQAGEERLNGMRENAAKRAAEREKELQKFADDRAAKRVEEEANKSKNAAESYDFGAWNAAADANKNIDKVGELGKIKDTVDISSEDLKTMRDLAEMNAIQNFVTLTPTVNITTGDIKNGVDLDTMIDKINEELLKEIEANSKGVYDSGG